MADVAKTVVVSKEDSDKTRVCSEITNICSSVNNACSSNNPPNVNFTEIESFSELSFKTTDEISLQDLIDSELAARLSCNEDEEDDGRERAKDQFDQLFIEHTQDNQTQLVLTEECVKSDSTSGLESPSVESVNSQIIISEHETKSCHEDELLQFGMDDDNVPPHENIDDLNIPLTDEQILNTFETDYSGHETIDLIQDLTRTEQQTGLPSEDVVDFTSPSRNELDSPPMEEGLNPPLKPTEDLLFVNEVKISPNEDDILSPLMSPSQEVLGALEDLDPIDDEHLSPVSETLPVNNGFGNEDEEDKSTEYPVVEETLLHLDVDYPLDEPLSDNASPLAEVSSQVSSPLVVNPAIKICGTGPISFELTPPDDERDPDGQQENEVLFKAVRPSEIELVQTNFDPFARIEEDSDSNPISNSNNMLNSPDEFQFPESPQVEAKDDVGVSDENLVSFTEQNYQPKLNNMSSVESVNNSFQNMSNLTSPVNEEEELFQASESSNEHLPDTNSKQTVEDDWTSVGHVIVNGDTSDVICDTKIPESEEDDNDSESRSEVITTEVKTTKKKKTGSDMGTKKTKKTKKSDEKENISVYQDESLDIVSPAVSLPPSVLEDSDDLSNVCVKNLKARSMMDLSYNKVSSSCDSRSTTNLSTCGTRSPVVTGVSVRALKEKYYSMINLHEASRTTQPLQQQNNNSNAVARSKINVPWSQSLKSSFNKFDQMSKKVLHVRSVDASKVQKQFNESSATATSDAMTNCKSCSKQVFQMERIIAEKAVWHKNCFRCHECNKQLTVDTYSSNEGILYCKPHFRELFKPKAVIEDDPEPIRYRRPEMIIRENQPVELPPDVFRASDKPDLGLEELSSLNVKQRYQMFEKSDENSELDRSPSVVNVKRSPSILSKLAKFQKKGMDIGVTDDSLNGVPLDQSSTSSEEEEEEEEETEEQTSEKKVIKSKSRKLRERPMSFGKMDDVKSVWENGVSKTKEELREERKQEIQNIRSRLFHGKQVKMKEAYEQAVRESESCSPRKTIDIGSDKAKSIKECFEKGEPLNIDEEDDGGSLNGAGGDKSNKKVSNSDDMSVFEAGISKKSRSLFLELDKSTMNEQQQQQLPPRSQHKTPVTPARAREVVLTREQSEEVVKSSDVVEDVQIETSDISSKFKFFETYREPEKEKRKFRITPPREGQVKVESPEKEVFRDPNVVRSSDRIEQEIVRTNTTAKMLSLFRQMEEKTPEIPDGPKPLKCFTPPPDYTKESEEESEDESEEDEEGESEEEDVEANPNLVRASDKIEDEYLKQAANAARAKQLRAKFEKWEEKEKQREQNELLVSQTNGSTNNQVVENNENVELTSIECTKSLRARFESMKTESDQPKEKTQRPKVNRFVEIQGEAELCCVCEKKVYQLEKMVTSGKLFHKSCFRCLSCNCMLRVGMYTLNSGRPYCLPHFKQLFICKGNYDDGFGLNQHRTKQ